MSQETLDLRRSIQIMRRHKLLVGIMVALGILAGGAYAVVQTAHGHEYRAGLAAAVRVKLQQSRSERQPQQWRTESLDGNPRGDCEK